MVASIRVNACHSLNELEGSFSASFYLDLAFWVPEFAEEFYADPETVGQSSASLDALGGVMALRLFAPIARPGWAPREIRAPSPFP